MSVAALNRTRDAVHNRLRHAARHAVSQRTPYRESLQVFKRFVLEEAVTLHGNKTAAASALGLTREHFTRITLKEKQKS